MRTIKSVLFTVIVILFASCKKNPKQIVGPVKQTMPVIKIQGQHFVTDSGKTFIPWGLQYTNTAKIPLIEDNWLADTTWAVILQDFRNMKALGANVVRIHLEFNKFMTSPTQPNEQNLDRLKQLVDYAEQLNVYLDVTGLACYRAADTPPWYDAMNEKDRWAAQAIFWQAIAKKIGGNNNVMAYNLMNEPVVPAAVTNTWLPGTPFGGYNFIQNVTRDPAGRSTDSVFRAWSKQLYAAIRQYDKKTLITVGFLPLGNIYSYGLNLDYLSAHVYPQTGQIPQQVSFVTSNFSQSGKPLIIEEFDDLYAGISGTTTFMQQTRYAVSGYISYYDGNSLQQLQACSTQSIGCAIQYQWINFYFGLNPNK